MLKNAYFLAKIGADTAEKERNFMRKSEKQKMEMKKENKYDTTRAF